MKVNILGVDGKIKASVDYPAAFNEGVRPDLIRRAVLSERSLTLQPQAHSVMAGMQTTAAYYGAMASYRTGRHVGRAIRPREKLGGGVQGKVKRIPSATKGRRAHPHMVMKTLVENMNRKEYQKAMRSAVAATAKSEYLRHAFGSGTTLPVIVSDEIEGMRKTKEIINAIKNAGILDYVEESKERKRMKLGRGGAERHYRKSALFIFSSDSVPAIRASRNIAGADSCGVEGLKVGLLAPGGAPGRLVVMSESALKGLDGAIGAAKPPLRR